MYRKGTDKLWNAQKHQVHKNVGEDALNQQKYSL